ncbi:hypothetical protein A9P82_03350 [Arachidicoccus ginsenosidimutans]|uniref:hypothetical protein n=1 Tax=Arachidicoccus sp. BS20 TaxID=1850526 RepID=UPI0007F1730B|nr:hypothetical protein [Arachidicoccus sp. BS20]ANI88421.1 hypothetical protein A9P82_03350 [Arachidicoccus sp. BS20]
MDLNFQQHIPANFSDESRVWIYQSNRLFSLQEAFAIGEKINDFLSQWNTHGTPNTAFANLFFGQFLIIMADESSQKVSGCSTDSSVRFVKEIEKEFVVNMFDRQSLAFIIKNKVQLLPLSQLNYAFENNFLNGDSLYFNNLVLTKKELLENWLIPVKESWLANRLQLI